MYSSPKILEFKENCRHRQYTLVQLMLAGKSVLRAKVPSFPQA
jgi:hypothetical protein